MAKRKEKKSNFVDYLIMSLFIVVILIVIGLTYYANNYINYYLAIIQDNIEKRLLTECRVIEGMVSVPELQGYHTTDDMETPSYIELRKELAYYADRKDLVHVYFMRLSGGQVQYIIDSDINPQTNYGLNKFTDTYSLILDTYNKRIPVFNTIGNYQVGAEGLLSAYAPILDEYGNIVAVIRVDISDKEIVERKEEAKKLTYVSIFSTIVLGVTGFIVIGGYRKKANDYSVASIAKGEFLSKMSHEMRTPMNAIIGLCRMIKKTDDLGKKDEYVDIINSSSGYLLELINGILDVSKIEANKMTLNVEKFSLREVMRDIEVMLNSQVEKKSQNLKIEIPDNIPKQLYGDKTRLTQIIVNLAANAVKFTPELGNVAIKIILLEQTTSACHLEFIVQDSGIGIEEASLETLFEPFEQADGSITRKFGGTGLGLTITKHLVEMMQGTISVSSIVGEGSIFRFDAWLTLGHTEPEEPVIELPKLETSDATIQTNLVEPVKTEGKGPDCTGMFFLVAEDNNINQMIAKDVFEGFGATVEFANNGEEAVKMFNENSEKYRIVFMDIQMPGMDGVEATKIIRSSNIPKAKTIPIIAMTAEVFQEDINKVITAGMNEHLAKPLDLNKVVAVINKFLLK